MASKLVLERKDQENKTPVVAGGLLMMTPSVGPDYWKYRVLLSDKQAVIGFPKFFTIGIGFAVEEDWNTNFPYTCTADEIFEHIKHNKGDEQIADEDVREAIRLIQAAVAEDGGPDA
jgi:hypothetical protein